MQLRSLTAYPEIVVAGVRHGLSHNVTSLAAAIAYNAFLAVPASLMVALGVFTLVERPDDVGTLVDNYDVLPPEAQTLITDTLQRLAQSQDGGPLVLVGLVVALWSVSGALTTMMWALTMASQGRRDRRSFVRKRVVALSLLGCVLLGAAALLVLQVFGPTIARETGHDVGLLFSLLRWPLLVAVLFLVTTAVMMLAPDDDVERTWSTLLPGSVFTVVVGLVASEGFAIYVSRFGSYNKAWGSLSGVIVLLVWLWLSGLAILLGGEINAEAARRREASR
ncbi:MAG: YihY/virulence factor BrkB family protein [Gaiellales bacterium]